MVPQIIKKKQNHKETISHGSICDSIINHKETISHANPGPMFIAERFVIRVGEEVRGST